MLRRLPMTCLNSIGSPLPGQDGDDDGGGVVAEKPAAVLGQGDPGSLHLAGAAATPERPAPSAEHSSTAAGPPTPGEHMGGVRGGATSRLASTPPTESSPPYWALGFSAP